MNAPTPGPVARSRCRLLAALLLSLLAAACQQPGPGPVVVTAPPVTVVVRETQPPVTVEVERVVTATPEPTPVEPKRLTVCMLAEPGSLNPLASNAPATIAVQQALNDGLIDSRSYQYQAVAFTKLPYVPDGDAGVSPVEVRLGDTVYDTATSQAVTITAGLSVTLAQPQGPPVLVDFTHISSTTTLQQWAQWTQVDGLTWEDGQPVTSDDALFAYAVASSPDTPLRPDWTRFTAGYQALNDKTVKWTGLPGYVSPTYFLNHAGFLPRHAYGRLTPAQMLTDDAVNRHPLGYGPFKLDEWVAGDHITLSKSPTYWRAAEGLPRLDQLTIRFVPDTDRLIAQVVSGRCDVATQDGAFAGQLGLIHQLQAEGQLVAQLVSEQVFDQLSFNADPAPGYTGFAGRVKGAGGKPVFADPRLRQAISLCLDRQRIVDQALSGAGLVQATYAAADHPFYAGDAQLATYGFDPARGLALLADAGWKDTDNDGVLDDGRGQKLSFVYSARNSPRRQAVTRLVQDQLLHNCQIETSVELYGPEYTDPGPNGLVFGRLYDMSELAFRSGNEPPCSLYTSDAIPSEANGWARLNISGYANPAFDEACQAALQSADPAEKAAQHAAAQELWAADLPAIILFVPAQPVLMRPGVLNVVPNTTASSDLWNVENFDHR